VDWSGDEVTRNDADVNDRPSTAERMKNGAGEDQEGLARGRSSSIGLI
jgi:hypothetical protein